MNSTNIYQVMVTSKSTKNTTTKTPNLTHSYSNESIVRPENVLNDKQITTFLKNLGININAKAWLFDTKEELIGVLQRNNEPYFFKDKELKLIGNNK